MNLITIFFDLRSYHVKVNDRWEVCVSLSDGQFQQVSRRSFEAKGTTCPLQLFESNINGFPYQVSFVNAIATTKGGTHVDYVTSQITAHVMNFVNKKNKTANVKAHNVKNYLWVFVNALIDNPAFDSQTKETLTLRQSSFGSKCELSQDFLTKGLFASSFLFYFIWIINIS